MKTNQLIICAILLICLAAALYAFIKTPPSQRWALSRPPEAKKEGVEYAPMYSDSERRKIAIIHISWLIPACVLFQFYLLPKFKAFAANAACYENGTKILFFGLLVGGPFLGAIMTFATQGITSLRALRAGQFPAPNVKVFRLTPYKYGVAARIPALFVFVVIALLLGMSLWGYYVASDLTKQVTTCQIPHTQTGLHP
jgi:hypothetical protein